jgi:hypothetical protein
MNLLSSLFSAIGAFFDYLRQRDAEKNTDSMRAAAQAKTDAETRDRASAAVQKGDIKSVRKLVSE